jgi:hypothetical protein
MKSASLGDLEKKTLRDSLGLSNETRISSEDRADRWGVHPTRDQKRLPGKVYGEPVVTTSWLIPGELSKFEA